MAEDNIGFSRDEESPRNLHSLFSQQATKFPTKTAIECEDVKFTYSYVDQRSNQFARFLLEKFPVQSESIVAILLPRSAQLYISMLGVVKAGAAYVCIDPQHQRSRLDFILRDTNAVLLVTTQDIQRELEVETEGISVLDITNAAVNKEIESFSFDPLNDKVQPSNLCYVIYTSGSTGNPKGVEIEHRTVLNFIDGELEIYPVVPEDRILQGFSPSFDASVEEIWLAFSTGATLVVATPEVMQSGPDLPANLKRLNITVFSTVPTLLRTLDVTSVNLPLLKLLIVGGEACGEDLIPWGEGRMFVNSYGPTEATVVATACVVKKGKMITIGKPLKNYKTFVVDDKLDEVPHGQEGELCIGGECLARGYRNLTDKTSQQFIEHPVYGRIYRTGDLVRYVEDDELEYLGRIDDQVKIRGFRVEVSSIETHVQRQDNVKMAAVVVTSSSPGQQSVIAHIALEDKAKGFDALAAVTNMKTSLPDYMVPNGYVIHDVMPTLASGKTDKKKLKALKAEVQPFKAKGSFIGPRNEMESLMSNVWQDKLGCQKISIHENFFDLGGQSVAAAMVVSELRRRGCDISVRDLYLHPTIESLSTYITCKTSANEQDHVTVHIPTTPRIGQPHFYLCGVLQCLWLLFMLSTTITFVMFLFLTFIDIYESVYTSAGVQGVTWLLLSLLLLSIPLYIAYTILQAFIIKKIFLGRVEPGIYALWSMYYLRWWILQWAMSWVPTYLFSGTPLMPLFARLMGARIGPGVYYDTYFTCDFDLLDIGTNVNIEADVSFETHRVDRGTLFLGRIIIKDNCSIGTRSTIAFNSIIGRNARVEPLTLVTDNSEIEKNSQVHGSPATILVSNTSGHAKTKQWSWSGWVTCGQVLFFNLYGIVFAFPYVVVVMVILAVPYLQSAFFDLQIDIIAMVIPVIAVFTQTTHLLLTAVLKWLLVRRLKEGTFSINSSKFVRYWILERIVNLTLQSSKELFATLYTNLWLKSLGMKVEPHVEVSTAFNFVPDLMELKEGSFVADHVALGGAVFKNGHFSLSKTIIGQRTFLGNNSVIQAQSFVGDNALIGVQSVSPDIVENNTSWLGSPGFRLPARAQASKKHSLSRTFNPPWYLYLGRLTWEFFKLFSPSFVRLYSLFGFWMLVVKVSYPVFQEGTPLFWLSASFWSLGIIACVLLLVILLKWILIGRFRPGERPLWSSFVWRSELIASLEENVAMPFGVSGMLSTPLAPWWYRAMGAKIGSRVYMASKYLTEADLIEIGDDSCIGSRTTIQSHLFEDRVMKMDRLTIGNDCTVCADSVVLYGAKFEDRCTLMPLSLCMKSEHLKHTAVYCGIPAREVPAELHHGYFVEMQLTAKQQEKFLGDYTSEVELKEFKKLADESV